MFSEFAVEPAAMVANVDRFLGLIDRFGVDQGRIISDFAKGRWSSAVIKQAEKNGFGEIAVASVVERLTEKASDKGIVSYRAYPDVAGDWTVNALAADARAPFAGIITEKGNSGHALECQAAQARVDRAPLRVADYADVPRVAVSIAAVAAPLIRISKSLHLVDPHVTFDGTPSVNKRWSRSLLALIGQCRPGMTVTIHTASGSPAALFEQNARLRLNPLSPGVGVRLRRWEQRAGGKQFHDRAILSEVGGLQFGHGLDEGPPGSYVNVHRLGRAGWEALLASFTPGTSPYDAEPEIRLK